MLLEFFHALSTVKPVMKHTRVMMDKENAAKRFILFG